MVLVHLCVYEDHCSFDVTVIRKICLLFLSTWHDLQGTQQYTTVIKRRDTPGDSNLLEKSDHMKCDQERSIIMKNNDKMWFSPVWEENMNYFMLKNTEENNLWK